MSRLTNLNLVYLRVYHTRFLNPQPLFRIPSSGRGFATFAGNEKKKVVLLGTGPAAVGFLKTLKTPSYDVHVVSPRNFFQFNPLLPSISLGMVEARSIVDPVRNILRKANYDVRYWEAQCFKIDSKNKQVHCRSVVKGLNGEEEFSMDYDYLVIATGARTNTFNTPGVEENCFFLKEIDDAQRIRKAVIDCFERASLPNVSAEEIKRLLHFVIVGGGPTGSEFAALLHDFVNEDLAKLYPNVKDQVKITLIEATDHILNSYDKKITAFAEEKFERVGIDMKFETMVAKVSDKEISIKAKGNEETSSLPYGMVLWSTGNGNRPVISDFMKQIGQANWNSLATDEWLRVYRGDDVYALGDCSAVIHWKIMEDIATILRKADKNSSETLSIKEFEVVLNDICKQYPQVELYMKNRKMSNFANLLKDAKGDMATNPFRVNIEEFQSALSEVHALKRTVPPTVQGAFQQGKYLADCFNQMGNGHNQFLPFRYHHPGKFAPVGGNKVGVQLPNDSVLTISHFGQWVWYYVYASKQANWRNTISVILDWMRRSMFGRHSTRI